MTIADDAADLASTILRSRLDRGLFAPAELFNEYAWDMMLALFISDARGARVSGREIVNRIKAPERVAARWMKHLTAQSLIQGDGEGNLDDIISLSPQGLSVMEAYLDHTATTMKKFQSVDASKLAG